MTKLNTFLDKKIEEARQYMQEQGLTEQALEEKLKQAGLVGKEEVMKVVPQIIESHEKMAYWEGFIQGYLYLKEVLEDSKNKGETK